MAKAPLIKALSYETLLSYLSKNESENKKDVYFLLKNGIQSCDNSSSGSIGQEIEKNTHFSTLNIDNITVYIESDLIDEIKKEVGAFIYQDIIKNKSHRKEMEKFIKNEGLSNKINLEDKDSIVKNISIEDLVDILNKMSRYDKLKELAREIVSRKGAKELKVLINKKTRFYSNPFSNKKNSNVFSLKKIEEVISSIGNKEDVYPNSCFSVNGQLRLVNLKNSIEFNDVFKSNEKINAKKINKQIESNEKVKTLDIDSIRKELDNIKKEINEHLSFFNELDMLTKENDGYTYYADSFQYNDIAYRQIIFEYEKASEELKAVIKNENSNNKFVINSWNLCFKIRDKISTYNTDSADDINAIYDEVKQNISVVRNEVERLKDIKNRIESINNEMKSYHLNSKVINDDNIKVKDINELENHFDTLSRYIDTKIEKRKKSFLSVIYKFFFPKSYRESLDNLDKEKASIDEVKEKIKISKEYLSNTSVTQYQNEVRKHYRVINEKSILATNVEIINKISFSRDGLSYIFNEDKKIKGILMSIYTPIKA
ncbi:TPA: hypothetical protein ACKRFQ_002898 [Proteus mirabilis]